MARMRRVRRGARTARGDAGVASITGFAAAVVVFAATLTAYLSFTSAPLLSDDPGPLLGADARGAAAVIVGSAGSALGGEWPQDPDHVTRFGLAVKGQPERLDLAKLRALGAGELGTNPSNGQLDYGEAKAALGAGSDDFHLRTWPLLPRLADAPVPPIVGPRVAYVADWLAIPGGGPPGYLVRSSGAVRDAGGVVYANVTVTNNGTTPAAFQVVYSVPLLVPLADAQQTGLLAPSWGQETVSLQLYKGPGWTWGGLDRNVTVTIQDSARVLGSLKLDLSGIDMLAGTSSYAAAVVSPEKLSYTTSQYPKIDFDVFNGLGVQVAGVNVRLNLTAADGTLVGYEEEETKLGSSNKWDAPKAPAGEYRVTLNTTENYTFSGWDRVLVSDSGAGVFTPAPPSTYLESPVATAERRMLVDLVGGFRNTTYDAGGDVYMDLATVENADLAGNMSAAGKLAAYDIVVFGSGCDPTVMTNPAATASVRDFVLAGGLLVVLGPAAPSTAWLQPLLQAAATTSGGGVATPDATNPILHTPDELAYPTYADHGVAWSLAAADAAHFTSVVVGGGGDELSVSRPGHFGTGSVVLSGWQAGALTAPQDAAEAERFLDNVLSRVRGALYVDFGPMLPSYAAVASASRVASATDPLRPSDVLLVRVVVYAFR